MSSRTSDYDRGRKDERNSRPAPEESPVKAADYEADENARRARRDLTQEGTALVHALLAIERRIYWHGLVMQQRP